MTTSIFTPAEHCCARRMPDATSRPPSMVDGEQFGTGRRRPELDVSFPTTTTSTLLASAEAPAVHRFLWPYRTNLIALRGGTTKLREIGLTWCEYGRFTRAASQPADRSPSPSSQPTTTSSSTGAARCSSSLRPSSSCPRRPTEDDHLALLGLLNSSDRVLLDEAGLLPEGFEDSRHRQGRHPP